MNLRRILITGVNGFVGSHLAAHLSENGYEVCGSGIQELPSPPRILYTQCDIRDALAVHRMIDQMVPDTIIHLAVCHGPHAQEFPRDAFQTNTLGTVNIFEACVGKNIRVLFVSSCAVYAPQTWPIEETDQCDPCDPYAISKWSAERFAKYYQTQHAIHSTCVRPFIHTGPGQKPIAYASKLARNIVRIEKNEREPTITISNPKNMRDYLDIRDVVAAYALLLESPFSGETYNICSGKGITIEQIAHTLCAATSIPIRIETEQNGKPTTYIGSYAKLHNATGWQPKKDFLSETLPSLLHYWRSELKLQD